jgi:AcrR family transcriptional regulator
MNEAVVLTPERILEVTEDVLRRFGLAKATVVDVARALDVSHGSVYRHFPSKASLRDAVAKRWLERVNAPLEKIAEAAGPAPARLERWLRALCATKQRKVCDDPEMFATYLTLAREARAVFDATSRYHHPAHAEEWNDPALAARTDALLALLLRGLEAPRKR